MKDARMKGACMKGACMNAPLHHPQLISRQALSALLHSPQRGQSAWWQQVARLGTPLRTPLADGQQQLTFLWRDPQGNAAQSETWALYIDMYSHTPHLTRQLTGFERLADSDIWCWQTVVAEHWLGSYLLLPVSRNALPAPDGPAERRRWWINLMPQQACADPLNPVPGYDNGSGVPLSAILPAGLAADSLSLSAPHTTIHIEPRRWQPEPDSPEYRLWHYRPAPAAAPANSTQQAATVDNSASSARPLVLLLDGHYWACSMPLFAALAEMTRNGQLPPAHYLFVDAVSGQQRSKDMACNGDFLQQLIEQQLHPLQQQGLISAAPQQRLIVGQSFGGLAAVYACLFRPDQFGLAFSQSGSFWWPDPAETGDGGWLVQQLLHRNHCPAEHQQRLRLEVGEHEPDMIGVSEALHRALQDAGFHSTCQQVPGGHDWLCWRHRLLHGLQALLGEANQPTANTPATHQNPTRKTDSL
ncbi:MAG: enterochelin esterase [Marinobacterium sp.]|nr:enterochelin esterase [Marinobacterium sp.]